VAAGDAHALGHVVDGDIVGVVELDVLDGVQDVLAGGGQGVGPACNGLLHQGGDEQVEIAHHGGLVLRLHPAGRVDVGQRDAHGVRVLGTVHRGIVRKGQLRRQLVGAGTVEAYPAVLPGLLLVGRIADELAGPCEEQIARADLPGAAAHLKHTFAREHQMDEVMVADAGAPGLARGAALDAAIEDGKFDVVRVILFEGLLVNVCHGCSFLRPVTFLHQYTTNPPANSTKVHLIL